MVISSNELQKDMQRRESPMELNFEILEMKHTNG